MALECTQFQFQWIITFTFNSACTFLHASIHRTRFRKPSDVVLAFSGLELIVPLGVELEVLFLVDAGTLLELPVPAVVGIDVIKWVVRVGPFPVQV